ncbi:MAG TPA: S9 family peptidase, partial [Burkholderiaceae bacterium]|nr:S9 family peptidase [Burkholderiaceae bacterium]
MKLRLLILGSMLAAGNAIAEPHGLTVEDMVKLERVGSPVLSPDASRVIYTVRATDIAKNHGHTELWMLDLRGAHAQPQRLTHSDANSSDPE